MNTLACIKKHTKVADLAQNNKVSRQLVYEAIKGQGTKRIRIEIVLIIERKPSEIWFKNNEKSLVIDDYFYMKSTKTANITATFKNGIA